MTLTKILALENELKLRLVTGAFEIVQFLYINGPTNSRELATKTKVSPANFQAILRRLREVGIVVTETEEGDRRRRRYALAPHVDRQIRALDL